MRQIMFARAARTVRAAGAIRTELAHIPPTTQWVLPPELSLILRAALLSGPPALSMHVRVLFTILIPGNAMCRAYRFIGSRHTTMYPSPSVLPDTTPATVGARRTLCLIALPRPGPPILPAGVTRILSNRPTIIIMELTIPSARRAIGTMGPAAAPADLFVLADMPPMVICAQPLRRRPSSVLSGPMIPIRVGV